MNCINNLIDLQLSCSEPVANSAYVYRLDSISWLNAAVFSRIIDNRYSSIDQLKTEILKNAIVELSNELSSFMSRKIQLSDFVGLYNDYGKSRIAGIKSGTDKGILVEKNYGCTGVKLALNEVSFRTNPDNSTGTNLTFYVVLDDGPEIEYTVPYGGRSFFSYTLTDANGEILKADNSISIFARSGTIEFIQVAIPCQTGCNGAKINECATVKGTYGTTTSLKETYGVTASVSCVCDFSDVFCSAASRSRIAELLLIRLEHHIAKYAFDNSRMDIFKLKADQIIKVLEANNDIYADKFTRYIEPIAFEIARNRNYKPCVQCRGVEYGIN